MNDRIDKIKTFLQQSPDDCFLNHALALEYIKLGDDIHAGELFKKNMAYDPGYLATYYHYAKLLERLGGPPLFPLHLEGCRGRLPAGAVKTRRRAVADVRGVHLVHRSEVVQALQEDGRLHEAVEAAAGLLEDRAEVPASARRVHLRACTKDWRQKSTPDA